MRMNLGMDMSANSVMELYGNFPFSVLKDGERIFAYCRKCHTELDLDQVVDHMIVNTENPGGHVVHFSIEKE
jgi:hypothetical protein